MEEIVSALFNYGVLGLWTITLLYSKQKAEERHQEQLNNLDDKVLAMLEELTATLETSLASIHAKLYRGLREMEKRYEEERTSRTQFSTDTLQDLKRLLD